MLTRTCFDFSVFQKCMTSQYHSTTGWIVLPSSTPRSVGNKLTLQQTVRKQDGILYYFKFKNILAVRVSSMMCVTTCFNRNLNNRNLNQRSMSSQRQFWFRRFSEFGYSPWQWTQHLAVKHPGAWARHGGRESLETEPHAIGWGHSDDATPPKSYQK